MEYWPRKGRPMLLAALEAVCDAVEDDLTLEIQKQDETRHVSLLEEITQLKAAATRAEQLENENQSLLQEIDQLRRKSVPQDGDIYRSTNVSSDISRIQGTPTPLPALAEISANRKLRPLNTTPADGCPEDKPNYEKEYLKVLRKYAALEARYEENQRKGRQFREARDGWMKYAQSIEAKMEKLEKKLQTKETADDQLPREPQPVETAAGAGLSGQTALDPSFTSDPGADAAPGLPKNPAREPTDQITAQALPASITEHAARAPNEDTDDGSEGASELPPLPPNMHPDPVVKIKQEPSSDPVIISEKPLRKRKHADDAGALTPLRRIKTESSGSSGLMITGEAPTFCPHESIDLDDEERGMPTPRKQRQAAQQQLREENLPSSEDDPPFELHHAASRSVQHVASTRDSVSNTRPVLSSLSTNKPARSDKDGRSPIKANWTLRSGLADVAEDSFEGFHSPKPRRGDKELADQTPLQGRLSSLLNVESPTKTAFLPPTPLSREKFTSRPNREDIENLPPARFNHTRTSPTKASSATPSSAAPQTSPTLPQTLPPPRPPHDLPPPRRLQSQPARQQRLPPRLRRGGAQPGRACRAHGVHRPELLRAALPADGRVGAGGGRGWSGALARGRCQDDGGLLGGGGGGGGGGEVRRLAEMTREERREVWLKAKVQDLANKYGRHRHRFERRPSPPGYWDPDFPSTQDIEKRKEEGERKERGLVEERWREAVRGWEVVV